MCACARMIRDSVLAEKTPHQRKTYLEVRHEAQSNVSSSSLESLQTVNLTFHTPV